MAGFTSVNLFLGVAIIDNIEKGDPIWIKGTSQLNGSPAIVTEGSKGNMIWIKGTIKLNESRFNVTDESQANMIRIKDTSKQNESRANVTDELRVNMIGIKETNKQNESRANVTDESRATMMRIKGTSKPNELRANVTIGLRANMTRIKGTSKLNESRSKVADESRATMVWIKGTSKLNESRANVTDKSRAHTTEHGSPLSAENRRFPKYGTTAFSHQCPWTEPKTDKNLNCTFLARPSPNSGEGISNWVAQIVTAHLLAQQTGCNLLFDYGPDINIHEVLTPISNLDSVHPTVNWRVPPGFDCEEDHRCFIAGDVYNKQNVKYIEDAIGVQNMVPVPNYRHAYRLDTNYFARMRRYRDLVRALPGYTVETGMACSLESLFHLSPSASTFEPDLFSRILPALHSSEALVISVYIRTGQTDNLFRNRAKPIIDCALNLEKENLSQFSFSRIVWMVVTDSPYLKNSITKSYDSRYANDTVIPREVITTHSRGAHSKPDRGPSTADVAEALIDWYLIGESDLVVTDDFAPSFGDTAATRTARPYYKVQGREKACGKVVPILK